MTTHAIGSWILLAALVTGGALPAQEIRATLPDPALEKLVAEALAQSPEVAASEAQAEAARARIASRRTLPDPSVSIQYQNDGTGFTLGERDMTFLGAMYSQPLPWPGKLRLAGEEAERRAEALVAEAVGRARLALEARVRRAYYDYLLAKALLDLVEERKASWRQTEGMVRGRYALGIAVQQDLLRAQAEVLRLDEARADLAALAANRHAAVNRLVRRPSDTPIETAGSLDLRAGLPELSALLAAVRERSPELAGALRRIEAERARVALARKDFFPDFTASAGPMYRGGLDPMWQAGIGVTLPIFARSRQGPLLAAARAELRSSESQAEALALDLDLATRERFESLKAALEVARLYRDGILPVDRLSVEAAVASYRAGKVPFVTVLEVLNALYGDRAAYLSRAADAEKWRVKIDEAEFSASEGMSPAGGAGSVSAPVLATPGAMGMR